MKTFFLSALFALSIPIYKDDGLGRDALFASIDPRSLAQNLAFYNLYPKSNEAQTALTRALSILEIKDTSKNLDLPATHIEGFISWLTNFSSTPPILDFNNEEIGKNLANRKLLGNKVWSKEELQNLPPEEIDLARGLLLYQFKDKEDKEKAIKQYEMMIDIMALQIKARVTKSSTPEELVEAINNFLFHDLCFRFPPHSVYAKNVDVYTFLPQVLDSRYGVCLGISTLYLCIAQRLGLNLDIITPPSHIYLCLNQGDQTRNIETTARGIDLPSKTYLGVNTCKLQHRNIKEVLGLVLMNGASVLWESKNYKEVSNMYSEAFKFLPNDAQLKMLFGLSCILSGEKSTGKNLLKESLLLDDPTQVSKDSLAEDFLNGNLGKEGIEAIFLSVDEQRESIFKKQKALEDALKHYPKFREGLLELASTWMQLSRTKEALDILLRYHAIDKTNCTVEYYLAVLSMERLDYQNAFIFLENVENLTKNKNHNPKAIISLRKELQFRSCKKKDNPNYLIINN